MLRSVAVFALSFAVMSGAFGPGHSARAQTETVAPTSEVVTPATQDEKKICKRSQKTGTRLGATRICKTAREWEQYEFQMRNDASTMTEMKGHTNAASGSGNN